MRTVTRWALLLFAALLPLNKLLAHLVTWSGSPSPMTFYWPGEFAGEITVRPEAGEPCYVQVGVSQPPGGLVSASIITGNPANVVKIRVLVLRAPINHLETTTLTVNWFATGFPPNNNCNGSATVSVPITVTDQNPNFRATFGWDTSWIYVGSVYSAALQQSTHVDGPWSTVGIGNSFYLPTDKTHYGVYFKQWKMEGGFISGYLLDGSSKPLSGLTMDLEYGGAALKTLSDGSYGFPVMPYGLNHLIITDPQHGASLDVDVCNTNNVDEDWFYEGDGVTNAPGTNAPPPTNVCNCTPWCAIGYGSSVAGLTPVFYSGGANNPPTGTPDCETPVVTVTPPSGMSFTITAGTNKHQSSGPNPASGVWTVTAVVCSQTKTVTIDVP